MPTPGRMRRRLFGYELRKTLAVPSIWVVASLALVVNVVMIMSQPLPDWADRDAVSPGNVYQGYDAVDQIAEDYIGFYRLSGARAERVRDLYEALQPVIDDKATQGDALDAYLGDQTAYTHEVLYSRVLPIALVEAAFLAGLLALAAIGHDRVHRTQALLWSSRVGRRVVDRGGPLCRGRYAQPLAVRKARKFERRIVG